MRCLKWVGSIEGVCDAKAHGLAYVEITVAHDNVNSQRVIEKCGAVFVEAFPLPAAYGEGTEWRYRIAL
jgi:predicted acetyltransferase